TPGRDRAGPSSPATELRIDAGDLALPRVAHDVASLERALPVRRLRRVLVGAASKLVSAANRRRRAEHEILAERVLGVAEVQPRQGGLEGPEPTGDHVAAEQLHIAFRERRPRAWIARARGPGVLGDGGVRRLLDGLVVERDVERSERRERRLAQLDVGRDG